MKRWTCLSILSLICTAMMSCATEPRDYDIPLAGPTAMRRTADGYELVNRWYRVVIDDTTGDVTYWGAANGQLNLLGPRGATARLIDADLSIAPTDGYLEKRDDQTWQYLGSDANQTGWRKIYCLEGRSLYATFLIENQSAEARPMGVTLTFDLVDPDVQGTDLAADGATDLGHVFVRGYPEHAEQRPAGSSSPVLLGDTKHLEPKERISFTTEWKIDRHR